MHMLFVVKLDQIIFPDGSATRNYMNCMTLELTGPRRHVLVLWASPENR